MSPMRILSIFPSTQRGGAEEYALAIARAAIGAGYQATAAFSSQDNMRSVQRDFCAAGAEYEPFDIAAEDIAWCEGGRREALTNTVELSRRLLRRIQPDAVHLTLPWPNRCFGFLLACRSLHIPTLAVFQLIRDVMPLAPRVRSICARLFRRHVRCVAVSRHSRELVRRTFGVAENDVTVIYNGAKTRATPADDATRGDLRARLGLPPSAVIALTVGRLHRQKGYHVLIDAMPSVLAKFPEMHFVWAGEGEYRAEFERAVAERELNKNVHMLGFRADVNELLAGADLFVFPTLFEGLPFSLIEAAACGLPIISTATSSIPELIRDGREGLLVPPNDADALAQGIARLLADPELQLRLGEAARRRAAEFSEERMTAETLDLLGATARRRTR